MGFNSRRRSLLILAIGIGSALLIQCRPLFWRCPPSWPSLAATGAGLDYFHLIPDQIQTLYPALYARDYTVTHIAPLYPKFWRETSAFLSFKILGNPVLGNWILSCLALIIAMGGMAALTYAATEDVSSVGVAIFFLMAGKTDPTGQYFLAMGDLAVPHEQALALFPWILFFLLKRTKIQMVDGSRVKMGRLSWPWEILILALAAQIHPPTAIYMALAIITAYIASPPSRPSFGSAALMMAIMGVALTLSGVIPSLMFLRLLRPPSADFFSWAYWKLYPISTLYPIPLRVVITFIFLSRWPLTLFAFWILARPWVQDRKNLSARVLFAASFPLTLLSLGRFLVLILPFSPSLIMGEFRAFMPAILPLIPLSANFLKPLENNRTRNFLILVLGCFLLVRSTATDGLRPPQGLAFAQKNALDIALEAKKITPRNDLILIPAGLMAFRAVSERATFGDFRALEMLLSFDRDIEDFYWPLCGHLNFAYRKRSWKHLEQVAHILKANDAVLPANWKPCLSKRSRCSLLYQNSEFSLIQIGSDAK